MPKKKSFFQRLTGAVKIEDYENKFEENNSILSDNDKLVADEQSVGELTIDVYETPNEIIIKTMVAGVKPENLDVQITRDMVIIKGKRMEEKTLRDEDYFHRELYWGSFSRSVLLPQEVEIDGAVATEKHGLLTLTLPKLDKEKQAKLKVRSS